MKPEILAIAAIFAAFAVVEAVRTGFLTKAGQRPKDVAVELIGSLLLVLVTQPTVLLAGGLLAAQVFPDHAGALADWPLLAQIALLLVFDDLTQYWLHRLSHTYPWLYKLHRAHHDAPYMSVRIIYRNNVFYYWLMPGLWFSGALIYLGLGWVYAGYIVVKMTVITGAHSDVRWDERLYRIPWLAPLMWVVERTISTPATHSAHHGRHADDGATHYKGNFGNLLFFWDVLFGTARITRRVPEAFGVEHLPPASTAEQLFWPLAGRGRSAVPGTTHHD